MSVALIVAASGNGVIGVKGGLPWNLPADMKFFKEVTMGHPVIMGRRTWESIPPRFRPLAGRRNIVITREEGFAAPEAEIATSIPEALALCSPDELVFIIGGASVYAESMRQKWVDYVFLTQVHTELEGDAFFTLQAGDWRLLTEKERRSDEKNSFDCTFQLYERVKDLNAWAGIHQLFEEKAALI